MIEINVISDRLLVLKSELPIHKTKVHYRQEFYPHHHQTFDKKIITIFLQQE